MHVSANIDYTQNSTDAGSSFVELKHKQWHFAARMAKLQLKPAFLTLSPLIATQPYDTPHAHRATNTVGGPERLCLKISSSLNIELLQFIMKFNILHKRPAERAIKVLLLSSVCLICHTQKNTNKQEQSHKHLPLHICSLCSCSLQPYTSTLLWKALQKTIQRPYKRTVYAYTDR